MFAVKQHQKPLSPWLLCGGTVFLAILVLLTPPVISAAVAGTIKACLIHTIDTSQWSPPSPDPMGIMLLPNGHLLESDSEVEECVNGSLPVYWHGVNLFEADTSGTLLATSTTYTHPSGSCPTSPSGTASNFSSEPTGMARNPSNGHFFFADDDQNKVFEVDAGLNPVVSFDTTAFGSTDPEGIAFARVLGPDHQLHDNLFVADGLLGTSQIYQLDPGPNGRFDGVPAAGGDDVLVNHFDTVSLGVTDPQGVAFNPDPSNPGSGMLYIVGADRHMAETTLAGTLLNQIDISALNACAPGDVVPAPSSTNPAVQHLYVADRGVDNNADRFENDGKIYEISLDPAECAQVPDNLLLNPGFELDCNINTFPDKWTSDSRFTRSDAVVHSGKYAGKHFATDDSSYTISQTVTGLSAGTTYTLSGWVNIPPTSDTFTFGLDVKWLNASNSQIGIQTLKTYQAPTRGWEEAMASLVAPAGTTGAQVQMVVSSLNATIYVDDFMFTATGGPPPTFDFSLSNGGNKSVTQGSSVTNTITATLVSGTSQPVTFSASGLPAGASASFSSTSCTPTCSTTLTLTTAASTPTGPATITVTGSGGGVTHTTSFTLTVNAPSTFDFSLANGGDRSVTQGSSVTNTITATLVSGSSQPVTFSASGLPTGASASFSAPSCSPTCSTTLTLTTAASTPTGPFPITVTGSGGGVTRTTSFTLTVNAPSTFDFSLANGGDRSVTQGSSVTNTITATLVSGTSQPVTFSASGLPAGASASFSSTSCTPTCSTTLTLTTAASTPTGPATITVTGSGGGVTRTTRFTLTVTAPFDFSLSNGGDKSVTQGSSVTNTITATLVSGSSRSVAFSASGLPTGASASFSSTSCTPTCSTTLTLTTAASTPTGPATITVTGSGGGVTRTTRFTLTINALPPPPSNLLLNPGFELDANGDGQPDSWSTSSKFTRSNAMVHSGSFAGKFLVTDNSSSTVNQTVNNLTAGTMYTFSGWVNIPPTIGLSRFTLKVRWLNASDGLISAQTIKTYTALTLGWDQATASMVAPAGTTHAQVEMTVETLLLNLNTTVYVDDFVFKQ